MIKNTYVYAFSVCTRLICAPKVTPGLRSCHLSNHNKLDYFHERPPLRTTSVQLAQAPCLPLCVCVSEYSAAAPDITGREKSDTEHPPNRSWSSFLPCSFLLLVQWSHPADSPLLLHHSLTDFNQKKIIDYWLPLVCCLSVRLLSTSKPHTESEVIIKHTYSSLLHFSVIHRKD